MTEVSQAPAAAVQPQHVVVMKEPRPKENRVAATPETVAMLVRHGLRVTVEAGAGAQALFSDAEYRAAGAAIGDATSAQQADILLHVRPLLDEQIEQLRPGTMTVGLTTGRHQLPGVAALRDKGCTTLAMELIPRISRAQSMDALTSQALVSGYRTVVHAALRSPRFFPMYMTAAGTIPPARVVVLGAGVAGLQAIGTAKRLGAIVEAYDVRSASADEITSMGGKFIQLDLETADGHGGYAKELSQDRAKRQQDALAPYIAKADILITTALIQGQDAPLLVTRAMIEQMKPGSVAIDMAAAKGGNIEGSEPGIDVMIGNCQVYGMLNPPSGMPTDASRLYAKNIANLLELGLSNDGQFRLNLDDEIMASCCLIDRGIVRHNGTRIALGDAPLPVAQELPTALVKEA
ncbi:MAG: NAD(P) transhydrogenase subunit alpha [Propionibacteriaceae bacterium]